MKTNHKFNFSELLLKYLVETEFEQCEHVDVIGYGRTLEGWWVKVRFTYEKDPDRGAWSTDWDDDNISVTFEELLVWMN